MKGTAWSECNTWDLNIDFRQFDWTKLEQSQAGPEGLS